MYIYFFYIGAVESSLSSFHTLENNQSNSREQLKRRLSTFSSTALFVCSLLKHIFLKIQRLEWLTLFLTIFPLVGYNFIINSHFTNTFKHSSMADLWSSIYSLVLLNTHLDIFLSSQSDTSSLVSMHMFSPCEEWKPTIG